MISKQDFMGTIGIVIGQFGDKNYGSTRLSLIYDAVKFLEVNEFKRICENLVGNSRNSPMLQDFVDLARPMLANKTKQNVDCNICNGHGYLNKWHKQTGVNYAFSCTCLAGNSYKAFIKINSVNMSLFSNLPNNEKSKIENEIKMWT